MGSIVIYEASRLPSRDIPSSDAGTKDARIHGMERAAKEMQARLTNGVRFRRAVIETLDFLIQETNNADEREFQVRYEWVGGSAERDWHLDVRERKDGDGNPIYGGIRKYDLFNKHLDNASRDKKGALSLDIKKDEKTNIQLDTKLVRFFEMGINIPQRGEVPTSWGYLDSTIFEDLGISAPTAQQLDYLKAVLTFSRCR